MNQIDDLLQEAGFFSLLKGTLKNNNKSCINMIQIVFLLVRNYLTNIIMFLTHIVKNREV